MVFSEISEAAFELTLLGIAAAEIGVLVWAGFLLKRKLGSKLQRSLDAAVRAGGGFNLVTNIRITSLVPEQVCASCGHDCRDRHWMCDNADPRSVWCPDCWPQTYCGRGLHGEGCPTQVLRYLS